MFQGYSMLQRYKERNTDAKQQEWEDICKKGMEKA